MKSFFSDKLWIILLAVGAFIALVILASGLGNMEFAQPFSVRLDRSTAPLDFSDIKPGKGTLWFRYLVPGLFLLIFLLMLGPVRPQRGNSVMNALMRAIAFILFFTLVLGPLARQGGFLSAEALEGMPAPGAGELGPGEFSPPSLTSGWAFWISSLLAVAFGFVLLFVLNRAFDRWFKPTLEMNEIAEIARTTLDDISGMNPSKNAIIRCYLEMNKIVGEKRGAVREAATTPAEFAARLEGMGLPRNAVQGLTDVFERVRYGGQEVSPEEIKEARRCLTGILKACGTKNR